jgi:hypothetical protein
VAEPAPDPTLPRPARLAVAVLAGAAIAIAIGLAIVHLRDRYWIYLPSGVWMALADYARDGILFPPLFDGELFGGTRYMPLPIGLHAGLASLTGEYLTSGKILGALSMVALGGVVLFAIGRGRIALALSVGLFATVLASDIGGIAGLSIRPEAIPVGFTVLAVAVVARSTTRRHLAIAAALCALAFASKLTAIVGPVAIGLILLGRRDRGGLMFFTVITIVLIAAALVLIQVASGGRMSTSLLELSGAGITPLLVLTAPFRALAGLAEHGASVFLLVPALALLGIVTFRGGNVDPYQVALAVAIVVLVALMADRGADYNHLLEVAVLLVIVVARLLASGGVSGEAGRAVELAAAAAIVVGLVAVLGVGQGYDLALGVRDIIRGDPRYDPAPLAGIVGKTDTLLSDDPYVPLSLGQRPVVLDPFMLVAIERRHPDWVASLAGRIDDGAFDRIVLRREAGTPEADAAYCSIELGPTVYEAILRRYRLDQVVPDPSSSARLESRDFFVYVPAVAGADDGSSDPTGTCEAPASSRSSASVGPANGLPRTPTASNRMATGHGPIRRAISRKPTSHSAAPMIPAATSRFRYA